MTGDKVRVTIEGLEPLVADVPADGAAEEAVSAIGRTPWSVRPMAPGPDDLTNGRLRREVVVGGWRFEVVLEDEARAALRERAGRLGDAAAGHSRQVVKAQIPGRVVRVEVAVGDQVEPGQRLLAVEAMKMENEVRATRSGTIARLPVSPGGTVERGQELVVIE
jgi:biotin carboxyl carrier protein